MRKSTYNQFEKEIIENKKFAKNSFSKRIDSTIALPLPHSLTPYGVKHLLHRGRRVP